MKDMPNGLSEVTLILNGKVLENAAVLRGMLEGPLAYLLEFFQAAVKYK